MPIGTPNFQPDFEKAGPDEVVPFRFGKEKTVKEVDDQTEPVAESREAGGGEIDIAMIEEAMGATPEAIQEMSPEAEENKRGMVALAKEMGGLLKDSIMENRYLGPVTTSKFFLPAVCITTGLLCIYLRGEISDLGSQADALTLARDNHIPIGGNFHLIENPDPDCVNQLPTGQTYLDYWKDYFPEVAELYKKAQIIDTASIAFGITSILAGGGTIWKAMKNRTKQNRVEKKEMKQ